MSIENTQHPDSIRTTAFLGYATGETDHLIAEQEHRGQQQLVHSDRLPSRVHEFNGSDAEFEALGFKFGEPDPKDSLFRPATLPDGWTKTGSDHDMWSYVIDHLGRRRVAVFYKAAFYDRRAFMRLITLDGYVYDCQQKGVDVVTDDTWATPAAVAEAATLHAKNCQARVEEWTQLAADRGTSPDLERYATEYAEQRDAFAAIAAQHTTA
ncbi:hypothetical protein [Streptomyces antibioticus]|uniref:hypothetical protein n=1 Tax=Streptomyces antibioticus TaxID=1890 RepID=UPI0033A7FFEC